MSLPERITSRILEHPETGCWEWQGYRQKGGYGIVYFEGRDWLVHRLVYTQLVGDIPAGLEIDHLCRNKACCNPDHLEAVTHAENVRRGLSGELKKTVVTHCPRGHEYAGENLVIRSDGARACRICWTRQKREATKRWADRNRVELRRRDQERRDRKREEAKAA